MAQSVSQFILFRVKPSVKPEDPSSEEGNALLNVFNMTKSQGGHVISSWGRTHEDENTIVWVVGMFEFLPNLFIRPSNYILPTLYGLQSKQINRLDRRPQHNKRPASRPFSGHREPAADHIASLDAQPTHLKHRRLN